MKRMSWKVLAIIAIATWLSPIFIASWLDRPYPSKPLPLKLVTWKEIGWVRGCTDFDSDGSDELIVHDLQEQVWAVWWNEGKCKREELPLPEDSWLLSSQQAVFLVISDDWLKFLKIRFDDGKRQVKFVPEEVSDQEASLGWQRIEKGACVALTDVDGDRRLDRIEWDRWENKLMVKTTKGVEWKKQKFFDDSLLAVKDLDGDGKAEVVSDELIAGDSNWRVICWYFDTKAKKWRNDSIKMPFERLDNLEDFPCKFRLNSVFAVKQENGFALIGLTYRGQRTKIWKLVWQGDRWRKELFDEFKGKGLPIFTGQDWLALTFLESPRWWRWIRDKVDELIQRLNFGRLPKIDLKMRLMGRIGKGKWVTLIRSKENESKGLCFADLEGDGLLEVALILRQPDDSWICVGKFVSGQWWLGKEKLPNDFVLYEEEEEWGEIFRHRGFKWVLWQDENNRCVAATVRRE